MNSGPSQRYAPWLWLLSGLFVVRTLAQPLALWVDSPILPRFDAWHSGVVPYPALAFAQLLIIAWLARTAWAFTTGTVTPRWRLGVLMLGLGSVYLATMVTRLVLGATILSHDRWFASPLPTLFHLVLAAFLLLYGHFHMRYAPDPMRATGPLLPSWHYPSVIAAAFALFAGLQLLGMSLIVSTYVPIVFTASAVTWLEAMFPHRVDWQPGAGEVRTDLAFMMVVQLALPPLVGFVFTYVLIEPARSLNLPLASFWPHGWPIWVQAVLMILSVDLLRYWLHRAAHESDTLWRLHSVHHSVERLYWLNTARFHPIEKTLQMLLDSVPFLLMAVDPTVLALYYIAYSTNGFFQHCNVRLRYGVLNYVVGSAETHRWHHSRVPRESNANYGNTVIVWDLVFGTWFLPSEREIAELGLQDPAYPKSFLTLMGAPFTR